MADPELDRLDTGDTTELASTGVVALFHSLKPHLVALFGSSALLVVGIRRDAGGWGAGAPVTPTAFSEMKSLRAFAHCSDASRASFASVSSCLVSSISSRTFFSSFLKPSISLARTFVSCSDGDGDRLVAVSIEKR